MKPVRLQLSRKKGFNLQALSLATNGLPAMRVDRSTPFGNPFYVAKEPDTRRGTFYHCTSVERAVELFQRSCNNGFEFLGFREDGLERLRGKNLACHCPLDAVCHADILLTLANT